MLSWPCFPATPPKTAKSLHTVALAGEVIDILRQHRAAQLRRRLLVGPDYAPYDLVFCSALGRPLEHRNAMRQVKRALDRAWLPRTIRFHDLRHAYATTLRARDRPQDRQ